MKQIVEWKFKEIPGRRKKILNLISENDEDDVKRISRLALANTTTEKAIESLRKIKGVGVALASVILTFYNPRDYCVFDIHVLRVEGWVIMVLKSVDYRLVEEKKGRIDRAVIVINNFHRLDLTKSEVWKLMQTLETVFDSMSDPEGIEYPFNNRKVVMEKGLKSPSSVKKEAQIPP